MRLLLEDTITAGGILKAGHIYEPGINPVIDPQLALAPTILYSAAMEPTRGAFLRQREIQGDRAAVNLSAFLLAAGFIGGGNVPPLSGVQYAALIEDPIGTSTWAPVPDVGIAGGYRGVADITARDAIPALLRRESMLVFVRSDLTTYRLGAGLGNGDWIVYSTGGGGAVGALDVFISSTGNDGNDGLTVGTPVATWARVWAVAVGADPVIVHITGNVTSPYVAPPTSVSHAILYGAAFTTVASGTAQAGTDAITLVLPAPITVDQYRHFTLTYTSGAAIGYRRQIRNTTTTDVVVVHPFERNTGAVTPVPGDTFQILRPSAKVTLPVTASGNRNICSLSNGGPTRIDVVNVAFVPSVVAGAQTFIQTPHTCFAFGMDIESSNLNQVDTTFTAGVDRDSYTQTVAQLAAILGVAGYVPGQWHGWGLAFSTTTRSSGFPNSGLQTLSPGSGTFTGFVTSGTSNFVNATVMGGSANTADFALGYNLIDQKPVDIVSFARPLIPFLAKSASVGRQAYLQVPFNFGSVNKSLVLDAGGLTVNGRAILETAVDITFTGANGILVNAAGEIKATDVVTVTGAAGTGLSMSPGANCEFGVLNLNTLNGIQNNGGALSVAGVLTATVTAWVLRQTAGLIRLAANFTGTGNDATLAEVSGGDLIQASGTFSLTNAAAGANDVLRVRANARAQLSGGASTVLDGSAGASGFGLNARLGGRVYADAQPSSVTGATADITAGTGGGENQPDTFLAASGSSLVSGDTLSAIARSA